jgi:hypothetical protein
LPAITNETDRPNHIHAQSTSAMATPNNLLAEPTFEECHAEWIQYHEDLKEGRIPLQDVLQGHYLAYYAGRLIDHAADMILLHERVAASLGIHPARLVIAYPWMW